MNVRLVLLPEGEDPDSFAKKNTFEDLTLYLEENAKDFIAFKATVLNEQSKNDPIKKAEVIRDMVTSISKIPDAIKTELYIKECAQIMDVSEQVLFSTLAQITNTEVRNKSKQKKQDQKAFDVVHKNEPSIKKVDQQYELERKIIKMLLLYGGKIEVFDEYYVKENEAGDLELEKEEVEKKLCQYNMFEQVFHGLLLLPQILLHLLQLYSFGKSWL